MDTQSLKEKVMQQVQGAVSLQIAYIAVANGLFEALNQLGKSTYEELAQHLNMDKNYILKWCEAAYSFDFLDNENTQFYLTDMGKAWLKDYPESLIPFAIMNTISSHYSEKAISYMKTGEQPGEKVIEEHPSVLPFFGPMLEGMFSGIFVNQILKNVPVYKELDKKGGLAIDLGCGNGWYLRKMLAQFPHLKGIGLDGFDVNINQAKQIAEKEGLGDRLQFQSGDLHHFTVDEPADLIAMNRALHHVWDEKENVFRILSSHLKENGYVIIWEPNWPKEQSALKNPVKRGMAFQNLAEHVQGNHFLRPDEIQNEFAKVNMTSEVYLFANDNEAVIVGKK